MRGGLQADIFGNKLFEKKRYKNTRLGPANDQIRPTIIFQNTAIQPKPDFAVGNPLTYLNSRKNLTINTNMWSWVSALCQECTKPQPPPPPRALYWVAFTRNGPCTWWVRQCRVRRNMPPLSNIYLWKFGRFIIRQIGHCYCNLGKSL